MWTFNYYADSYAKINFEEIALTFPLIDNLKNYMQEGAEFSDFVYTKKVIEKLLSFDAFNSLELENKHILFLTALLHRIGVDCVDNEQLISRVSAGESRKLIFRNKILAPFNVREQVYALILQQDLAIHFLVR